MCTLGFAISRRAIRMAQGPEALGLLIIVIAVPLAVFVRDAAPLAKAQSRVTSADVKRAFKTFSFALLIIGSMCSIAAVSGTQQSLKLFLSLDQHYTQSQAAQVLSLVLGFSIIGRLVMGWLADRFDKKYVMLLIYLLVASAIPLIFLARHPLTTSIAAAIFGIGLGGDYMIIPLMAAEIFGVQILGRLMGVLLGAGGIAKRLRPGGSGASRQYRQLQLWLRCTRRYGIAWSFSGLSPAKEAEDRMNAPIVRLASLKDASRFKRARTFAERGGSVR